MASEPSDGCRIGFLGPTRPSPHGSIDGPASCWERRRWWRWGPVLELRGGGDDRPRWALAQAEQLMAIRQPAPALTAPQKANQFGENQDGEDGGQEDHDQGRAEVPAEVPELHRLEVLDDPDQNADCEEEGDDQGPVEAGATGLPPHRRPGGRRLTHGVRRRPVAASPPRLEEAAASAAPHRRRCGSGSGSKPRGAVLLLQRQTDGSCCRQPDTAPAAARQAANPPACTGQQPAQRRPPWRSRGRLSTHRAATRRSDALMSPSAPKAAGAAEDQMTVYRRGSKSYD